MRKKLLPLLLIACAMGSGAPRASAADRVGPVVGVIVAIDRSNRAITVKDLAGGAQYRVVIPKGQKITIVPTLSFGSSVDFERLIIGLQYRGVGMQ